MYYNIINHSLSKEQLRELNGEIIIPSEEIKKGLLQSPANEEELLVISKAVVDEAASNGCSVILAPGGSPAFMAMLIMVAIEAGLSFMFSHSVREFTEIVDPDGTTTKTNVFRHVRWLIVGSPKWGTRIRHGEEGIDYNINAPVKILKEEKLSIIDKMMEQIKDVIKSDDWKNRRDIWIMPDKWEICRDPEEGPDNAYLLEQTTDMQQVYQSLVAYYRIKGF